MWYLLGYLFFVRTLKVYQNTRGIHRRHHPSFPYKLTATLGATCGFMQVEFMFKYGGAEIVVVLGKSRKSLEKYAKRHLYNHPRFRQLTIVGPDEDRQEMV